MEPLTRLRETVNAYQGVWVSQFYASRRQIQLDEELEMEHFGEEIIENSAE
jgi:hypothetical protein